MTDDKEPEGGEEPTFVDRRASARMDEDGTETSTPEEQTAEPEQLSIEDLREQLESTRAAAERFEGSWKRAAADLANYKRRVDQERSDQARLAGAALVINLLPIRDDFGRAVETLDSTLAGLNWVQGVLAIERKLGGLIESMGVTEVPAEGETFDPTQHEAVGKAPGPENVCLHVVQKGYALNGAVIRPAMVIVGEGGEMESSETTESENEGA
ncbi:MAG TPA: nucleotide exchange factor GrpE [Dehalococcoidia bacterium]|nr:nucleotide exchange factor GrpE [Dehalococcoidia bacterium]|tara:strand:- start:10298 stop:10936 length:639 start_codon:yes stop_codon:yes gene_type:complete